MRPDWYHPPLRACCVLLPVALSVIAPCLGAQEVPREPGVVPVYLVPTDLEVVPARVAMSRDAIEAVRQWYARVLGGRTFRYDPLVVQISSHTFADFAADSFQAWWPLLQEEFKRYGQDWEDDDTKLLWIAHGAGAWAGADSENGGIDSIAEAGRVRDGDRGGLAVIGDSTIGGVLAGVCPDSGRDGTAWWCSWKTFQGTVAHELGHTWGLPHPDAFLPGFRCADSTAWTNMQCHWGFPFDSLLTYEQVHLRSLRHFQFSPGAQYLPITDGRPGGGTSVNFSRDSALLWLQGRGGGTGYLWGMTGTDLRITAPPGEPMILEFDLGFPREVPPGDVTIFRDKVELAHHALGQGLPRSYRIPIAPGQQLRIRASTAVGLGHPRLKTVRR